MRRTIKKYEHPDSNLPGLNLEGLPLLSQAATQAALDDLMASQRAALDESFSKSVDAERARRAKESAPESNKGSFGQ